eukprot:scaffold13913_cov64-Phaeocystis_antarctica.AAC.5
MSPRPPAERPVYNKAVRNRAPNCGVRTLVGKHATAGVAHARSTAAAARGSLAQSSPGRGVMRGRYSSASPRAVSTLPGRVSDSAAPPSAQRRTASGIARIAAHSSLVPRGCTADLILEQRRKRLGDEVAAQPQRRARGCATCVGERACGVVGACGGA